MKKDALMMPGYEHVLLIMVVIKRETVPLCCKSQHLLLYCVSTTAKPSTPPVVCRKPTGYLAFMYAFPENMCEYIRQAPVAGKKWANRVRTLALVVLPIGRPPLQASVFFGCGVYYNQRLHAFFLPMPSFSPTGFLSHFRPKPISKADWGDAWEAR